jgi:hypothetical protein
VYYPLLLKRLLIIECKVLLWPAAPQLYSSIKWLKIKLFKLPIFYFLSPDFGFLISRFPTDLATFNSRKILALIIITINRLNKTHKLLMIRDNVYYRWSFTIKGKSTLRFGQHLNKVTQMKFSTEVTRLSL